MAEPAGTALLSARFDPADWPTPAYAYDLAEVRAAHEALRRSLPEPSTRYYSLKANPHPAVVSCLHGLGARAEVSSAGELAAALAAGVPPGEVLCTGPGKSDREVLAALELGVRDFSVDSAHGVAQLGELAARTGTRPTYLLRINPDEPSASAGLRMTGGPSQFGADVAAVLADPGAFRDDRVEFAGLHLYLATNLHDPVALLEQFGVAVRTAKGVQAALDCPLRVLDLGGGFGAPYAAAGERPSFPGLAEGIAALLDGEFPDWRGGAPEVAFESGRFLTGTCGRLFTRVLDVKRSHGRRVVVLDSGIHQLGGMAGLRRVPPLNPAVYPTADAPPEVADDPAMICGPLCTPLDTWSRSAPLPEVRPGDLLEVPNVGAYGLSASLVLFLGHELPEEIVLDGPSVLGRSRLSLQRREIPGGSASRLAGQNGG